MIFSKLIICIFIFSAQAFSKDDCLALSQAAMNDCLSKKEIQSLIDLETINVEVLNKLSKWDEDKKYIKTAKDELNNNLLNFKKHRDSFCLFAATLSGGAAGAVYENSRLACHIEENNNRALKLKKLSGHLPLKK